MFLNYKKRLTPLFTLLLLVSLIPAKAPNPDLFSGLVGWWGFDEGSGVLAFDYSGNVNTGTLLNGPVWVAGKVGTFALRFDGLDDYVNVPDSSSLNPTSSITVSGWFNWDGETDFYQDGVVKQGQYLLFWHSGPIGNTHFEFIWTIWTGGVFYNINMGNIDSELQGGWHFLAGTYDGNSMKLYIDGELRATRLLSGPIDTTTNPLQIGARNVPNFNEYYKGSIDDVRVYNRALLDNEIRQLFHWHPGP